MSYPFLQSRWYQPGPRRGPVNKIVLHTMESPCTVGMAHTCAQIAAVLPEDRKVSAHFYVDPATVWQGVHESDIAYAAPGANNDGIQIEQAGYAAFTTADWSAPDQVAMEQIVAALIADLSVRFNIPLRFCSAADMLADADAKGVTTHVEVNNAFHRSNHTDPGPNYPLDYVLIEARALLAPHELSEDDLPTPTIRNSQTGEINTFSGGARRKFHLAPGDSPAVVQHNLDLLQKMKDKGLIAQNWIELDDETFNAIPELT